MNKYLEAEKRLAELVGWDNMQEFCALFQCSLYWCRSNDAAFALMVEHGIAVRIHGSWTTASTGEGEYDAGYANHPDKETAVRYAIVMAVITKLEAQRG